MEFDFKVELHAAYAWTCPACGRDNFERAITLDEELASEIVSADRRSEIADILDDLKHDFEHFEVGGFFCSKPATVKCSYCDNSVFEVLEEDS